MSQRIFPLSCLLLACLKVCEASQAEKAERPPEPSALQHLVSHKMESGSTVAVYSRPVALESDSALAKGRIALSLIWVEVKKAGCTEGTAVWKQLVLRHRVQERKLRNFTVGPKNDHEIALGYVEGPAIRFWEVRLDRSVDISEHTVVEEARRTSFPLLHYRNIRSNVPVRYLLKEAGIENCAPKLEKVSWEDGRWRVQASIGEREVTFERGACNQRWQLIAEAPGTS